MSRFTLAFRCFFGLLFGGSLPAKAARYLPAASADSPPEPSLAKSSTEAEEPVSTPAAKSVDKSGPNRKKVAEYHEDGSLALLALFQREGRLVDFLQEDITDYGDDDVGAAVRDIHRGCRKVLNDYLTLEAVMPGAEDDKVTVKDGFDPGEIKLVGEVKGEPPFHGIMRHHGWKATATNFPKLTGEVDRRIVAAAQVEVQ